MFDVRLRARPLLASTALVAALSLAACGSDEEPSASGDGALPAAGGGGVLSYAVSEMPESLDPLAASSRAAQIVTRQVHEPLVAATLGPYGARPAQPGLAVAITPSADRSTWSISLRPGVSFQDGAPFDVGAVLANARRWSSTSRGRRLLPGLFAADTPRPGVVRLLFERAQPDAAALLASPRLGIVSPRALEPVSGERAVVRAEASATGTGPFELGAASEERIEVARYAAWWGSPLGLGPALDSVVFVGAPNSPERLRLLRDGQVQAIDPVGTAGARLAASDPLLRSAGGPSGVGYVASVRGLAEPPEIPQLSSVWLTTID